MSANFAVSGSAVLPAPVAEFVGGNFRPDCSARDLFPVCQRCQFLSSLRHMIEACQLQSPPVGRIFDCFLEEFQCSSLVPRLRHIAFQNFAFVIYSSPQVVAFAVNFHEQLI